MANLFLTGSGAPTSGIGEATDYYRDMVTNLIYYKDSPTNWVGVPSLIPTPDGVGTTWLYGNGEPDNGIGSANDYYRDDANGSVYRKHAVNGWEAKGSLDFIGVYGVQWGEGTGAPANIESLNNLPAGSFYLDVATSDIYYKDNTLTWSNKGQLGVGSTGLDAIATAADRVQTGLDAVATAADAVATAADRVQTGLDATATNASAVAAALSATNAGDSEALAITYKTNAQAAQAAAEVARDAAIATGKVYANTAEGIAATTTGQYFSVVDALDTNYLILYLNNAGVAVEQKRYPSVEAIALSGYDQSGYIWAQVDSSYRVIFGVDSDGLFQKFKTDSINFNGQAVNYESSTEYQQSGYVDAVVGTNYAILQAVDEDGVLVVSNIYVASPSNTTSDNFNGQAVNYESSTEYQQAGYIEAEIDSSYRLIVGVTSETYPKQAGAPACLETNANKWVDVDSSYAVYSAHNSSNLKQLYRYSKTAGTTTALTSKFNNVEPVLAGSTIVFTSDRPEPFPTKNMWWCAVTNASSDAGVNPVFPKRHLVNYSDSIYAGTGASDADHGVTALVAASLGLSYTNNGIGGQTSQQIAQRFGALTTRLTVTGNQIPTSGAVSVTHINNVALAGMNTTQFPDYRLLSTKADNTTRTLVGTLGGVYGTLTRSSSSGPPSTTETYTFTRAKAGSVVSISANETFTVDVGDLDKCVLNIEVGANDVAQNIGSYATAITAVTTNIAAMVARCRTLHLAYVVVGFPSTASAAYYTGTALATALTAWRASMASTYGARWYDTMPVMLANGDGSPTDNAAIANGVPPPSLLSDVIHWNDAGHAVNATATAAKFTPQLTF